MEILELKNTISEKKKDTPVTQKSTRIPEAWCQETRTKNKHISNYTKAEQNIHLHDRYWYDSTFLNAVFNPCTRIQCYGLKVCGPPWNPYVKALIPSVIVLGHRAYEEMMRIKWGHKDGTLLWQWRWCCKRERHRNSQSWPLQDTARRQPYSSQKESSHLEPNLLASDLELPAFRIVRK